MRFIRGRRSSSAADRMDDASFLISGTELWATLTREILRFAQNDNGLETRRIDDEGRSPNG